MNTAGERSAASSLVEREPTLMRGNVGRGHVGNWMAQLWRMRAILVALILALAYTVVVLFFLPRPPVLSITSAVTELVSFKAVDGRKAAFYVQGMRLASSGAKLDGMCVAGLVTPVDGSTVSFGRVGAGPTEIRLTTPDRGISAVFEPEKGSGESLSLAYLATDPACKPSASARLPIWGVLSLGTEFRPQASPTPPEPRFLVSGKLKVWGKEVLSLSGPPSLYPVAEFALPVGSRLAADAAPTNGGPPIWWGLSYSDPDKPALSVDIASESRQLALFRPSASRPDVIGISWLSQVTQDPSILELHAAVFGCIGLIAIAIAIHDHLTKQAEAYRRETVSAPAHRNETYPS